MSWLTENPASSCQPAFRPAENSMPNKTQRRRLSSRASSPGSPKAPSKFSAAHSVVEMDSQGAVQSVQAAEPDAAVSEGAAEENETASDFDAAMDRVAETSRGAAERMAHAIQALQTRSEVAKCNFCKRGRAVASVEVFGGFYTVQACQGCIARGGLKVAGKLLGFLLFT